MQTFVDIVTAVSGVVSVVALVVLVYAFYTTRKPRHGGPHSRSAR